MQHSVPATHGCEVAPSAPRVGTLCRRSRDPWFLDHPPPAGTLACTESIEGRFLPEALAVLVWVIPHAWPKIFGLSTRNGRHPHVSSRNEIRGIARRGPPDVPVRTLRPAVRLRRARTAHRPED